MKKIITLIPFVSNSKVFQTSRVLFDNLGTKVTANSSEFKLTNWKQVMEVLYNIVYTSFIQHLYVSFIQHIHQNVLKGGQH